MTTNQRKTRNKSAPRLRKRRTLMVFGYLIVALLLTNQRFSVRAEYETPQIDTAASQTNVEFRGVWGMNRGQKYSSTKKFEGFESYAVGVDPTIMKADQPTVPDPDRNGLFFYSNGSSWGKITTPMGRSCSNASFKACTNDAHCRTCSGNTTLTCTSDSNCQNYNAGTCSATVANTCVVAKSYSLNAVSGQVNSGYGGPMLMVAGVDGQISGAPNIIGDIGLVNGTNDENTNRFIPIKICKTYSTDVSGYLYCSAIWAGENGTTSETRDFYAVDGANKYNYIVLAGGQTIKNPSNPSQYLGPLYAHGNIGLVNKYSPPINAGADPGLYGAKENIVGIKFVDLTTAYVLTSTFKDDDRYATSGRNCDESANQYTALYRVTGLKDFKTFYKIQKFEDVCGYGLAAGINETPGFLRNNIWIATSNGMYSLTDTFTQAGLQGSVSNVKTPSQTGTDGQAYYSVAAVSDRGGSSQNMMVNSDFSTWTGTATTNSYGTESGVFPYNWVPIDRPSGFDGASTCVPQGINTNDYQRINYQAAGMTSSSKAIRVWPAKPYPPFNACNNPLPVAYANPEPVGFISSVDLTTVEGQRFEVSGKYRVRFQTRSTNPADMPNFAAGGVTIGCGGNDQPGAHRYVDCSVKNRSQIRSYAKASANGGVAIDQSTTTSASLSDGWVDFSIILSREDLQIGEYYDPYSGLKATARRLDLEVRCEATYGADVACDDIQVKELSSPPISTPSTYLVTAAGRDRGLVVNRDALHVYNFVAEDQPTFSDVGGHFDYQGIFGSGLQHVSVVGTAISTENVVLGNGATSILSRTPSTLVGSIWVGTADNASTQGSGYISVSCINTRDSVTSQTLCQQSPQSYGLSLDMTGNIGVLSGRAWYGKSLNGFSDYEKTEAGVCTRNEPIDNVNVEEENPYNISGMCDKNNRLCWSSRTNRTKHSSYSCLSDFDCFGKCSKDPGRICYNDGDCRLGSDSYPSDWFYGSYDNTAGLTSAPSSRLSCSVSSPLACSSIGWLSLNGSDFPSETAPGGAAIGVNYNTIAPNHNADAGSSKGGHELSGWARFMTMATTNLSAFPQAKKSGWVRFRGDTATITPLNKTIKTGAAGTESVDYLFGCQDCAGNQTTKMNCAFCMDRLRHSCIPSDTSTVTQCTNFCVKDPSVPCLNDSDCVPANGDTQPNDTCRSLGVCTGDMSNVTPTSCRTDNDCTGPGKPGGYCRLGMLCRSQGAQCAAYGAHLSSQTGQYSGFAWSEDLGWLDFRGVGRASSRYIQTQLGDILAKGNIGNTQMSQPQGVNNCNATFLILAGGTIASNWCSALSSAGNLPAGLYTKQSSTAFQSIAIPKEANLYQNALGRIDVPGLENETQSGSAVNKYGSPIVTLTPVGVDLSASWNTAMGAAKVLGGKVYHADCRGLASKTCTIDGTMNFATSTNITAAGAGSGAGILVVHGNLRIKQNMEYKNVPEGPVTVSDPRQVASLTVIVVQDPTDTANTGNLTIDNGVSKMVGAYYVPGTINTASDPADSSVYTTPLVVRGLMITSNFSFGRKYAGTSENPQPSELIVFDGRLQTNPMPGLTDFARILPAAVSQP